jgi:hypothetical protein
MPTKTTYVTENDLRSVTLPNHGGKYAVVPHGTVIDEARKQLAANGFQIERELYKSSKDGQIAQGVYHLKNSNDTDMGLMFAWSNSYNKQMKFKCAIGAQVFICMNGVVSGDMASYNRKHMGNSTLQDVFNSINEQVSKAHEFFARLVADKNLLKNITLSPRDKGSILGELFANDEILTLTQVGIVKRELDNPTHNYNVSPDSAWAMYNYITYALKESHPGHYIDDHRNVHNYFVNKYGQLVTAQPVEEEYSYQEEEAELENPGSYYVTADDSVNFV